MASSGSKSYRVCNPEISYPTDPAIIARLLAGENMPVEERGLVTRKAGEIVTDIPACSIPALLAQGDIEAIDGAPISSDEVDDVVEELKTKADEPTKPGRRSRKARG